MSTNLAVKESIGEAVERVMIAGDLAKLTPDERVGYYRSVCDSVGLNPLTRPLEYITLNARSMAASGIGVRLALSLAWYATG